MRGIVSGLVLAVPALVAWGSIALAEEPPGRTQVGESHVINSTELKKVRERVDAALAPIALTAVVDPATTQSAGPAIGRVITPVQSATREDGTTVTVMSAWERACLAARWGTSFCGYRNRWKAPQRGRSDSVAFGCSMTGRKTSTRRRRRAGFCVGMSIRSVSRCSARKASRVFEPRGGKRTA
jgi:hypothetical protein